MSFKSKLKVAGKEVNVLACSYALKQETDATGRPSSITRGGKITLTVESTGDTSFFEWMTNNFERKDGSIVFVKRDTDATLKELKFTEAYLVDYKENFDNNDESPITETFTLSAQAIEVGSGKHTNEWVK
jgi:type VI protein secretion system component Hcp